MMCFAIGSSFVLGGNRPNCDGDPPTLTCDTVSLNLDPGSCVEITNPCGAHQWERLDGFRLCDPPEGLFIQTQRSPRARFLCADARVATLIDEPVDFFYTTLRDSGVGQFRVTIGSTPLEVIVSASPSSILAGGQAQLESIAVGGLPPYSYQWTPANGLSATDVPNPMASPSISTQYTAVVTDSTGAQVGDAVIVNVGIAATAAASPTLVDPGQPTNLSVQVAGGTPPYQYAWTPSDTLSSASDPAPVATPDTRTTYSVTVTDFFGETAMADVTVDVTLSALASANPATITAGGQSQLDVAVAGGAPPYTFDWSPAASLDDSTVQNPVAAPTQTTTYSVLVTDSTGAQAASNVDVTVQVSGVNACMVVTQVSAIGAQADGSCSSGSIVQYRWWGEYRFSGQPPEAVTTSPISPVFLYELSGEHTIRLEVVDASGATAATTATFISQ